MTHHTHVHNIVLHENQGQIKTHRNLMVPEVTTNVYHKLLNLLQNSLSTEVRLMTMTWSDKITHTVLNTVNGPNNFSLAHPVRDVLLTKHEHI